MTGAQEKIELRPHRPARRRPWTTLILAIVIFVGGFVAGAGVTVIAVVGSLQQAIHHPEKAPRRITRTLRKRLRLTPAQTRKVLAIVTDSQQEFLAIRREMHPRVVAELNQTYGQIAEVLSTPQKARWRRLFAQLRATWLPDPPPPRRPATAPSPPTATAPSPP